MTENKIESIITRLRKQGRDDGSCEVKECAQGLSKDIWETVSAFANTEGGLILLGLSEKNGFIPVDDFDLYKTRDQFISGIGDGGCEGHLTSPPHYTIDHQEIEGAQILVIEVDELDSSNKPCYITKRGVPGGSYKRVDDADILLSANEIFSLFNACVNTDADRVPVPRASLADLDEKHYKQAFAKAEQITPRALYGAKDVVTKLQRLNYIDGEQNKGRAPVGGVLSTAVLSQASY